MTSGGCLVLDGQAGDRGGRGIDGDGARPRFRVPELAGDCVLGFGVAGGEGDVICAAAQAHSVLGSVK